MKGIQTDYTELRDRRVNRNDWESLLGRLDAVGDEISRALNRTTRIEEPGSGVRIARTPKVVVPGSTLITDCDLRTSSKIAILVLPQHFSWPNMHVND